MINQEYYDSKTGKLKPSYAWHKASYQLEHPELDQQASLYAALFVHHPATDPYEAYIEKIQELINIQPIKLKPELEAA